jgi:hypothetical protein
MGWTTPLFFGITLKLAGIAWRDEALRGALRASAAGMLVLVAAHGFWVLHAGGTPPAARPAAAGRLRRRRVALAAPARGPDPRAGVAPADEAIPRTEGVRIGCLGSRGRTRASPAFWRPSPRRRGRCSTPAAAAA